MTKAVLGGMHAVWIEYAALQDGGIGPGCRSDAYHVTPCTRSRKCALGQVDHCASIVVCCCLDGAILHLCGVCSISRRCDTRIVNNIPRTGRVQIACYLRRHHRRLATGN